MCFKILLVSAAILQYTSYVEGRIPDVTTEGCSVTKSCFKLPSGCKNQSDCDAFSSWISVIHDDVRYLEIEMFGKVQSDKGYIATGFNKAQAMNDAGVVGCYIDSSGSAIQFKGAYNQDYDTGNLFVNASPNFLVTSGPGSEDILGGYFIGSSKTIVCRIRRLFLPSTEVDKLKDLSSPNKYHVLISRSDVVLSVGLGKHFTGENGKAVSDQAFDFGSSNASVIEISGNTLIKAHGGLMIVAWLLCANLGIIMARYMKPIWPDKTCFGQKVWFQIHRGVQMLCVLLSSIAFIIIFVKIGGYSQLTTFPGNAHPVLGIIVMSLAILNPITAIFRPSPDDRKRPIFNWIHFCIGSMAQMFSVITIFIGVKLEKVGDKFSSSDVPFWILVGCVAFIVAMEIVFAIDYHYLTKTSKSNNLDSIEMRQPSGIHATSVGGLNGMNDEDRVKSGVNQRRRKTLLAIYFLGIAGCTLALVILLATS